MVFEECDDRRRGVECRVRVRPTLLGSGSGSGCGVSKSMIGCTDIALTNGRIYAFSWMDYNLAPSHPSRRAVSLHPTRFRLAKDAIIAAALTAHPASLPESLLYTTVPFETLFAAKSLGFRTLYSIVLPALMLAARSPNVPFTSIGSRDCSQSHTAHARPLKKQKKAHKNARLVSGLRINTAVLYQLLVQHSTAHQSNTPLPLNTTLYSFLLHISK